MKRIYNISLIASLICFSFMGCKSAKPLRNKVAENIPATFKLSSDTANKFSKVNWSDYFQDKQLINLIDTALKNNFDLFIAYQKMEVLRAQARLHKNALFPSVSGVVSAAQRRYGLYTMDGAGNISTEITPGQIVPINLRDYYVGFQAAWELDVWGKLRNKKKAALARFLSGVEGSNLVITNLIAEVATSYYELLALDNELLLIRENIVLQQNALEIVRYQKAAATANELAVKQFEAQLLNSKALEVEILLKLTRNENTLNFLLGRFPQSVSRINNTFLDTTQAQLSVGIPSNLLKNRPDIRKAEFDLIASKADLKAARAAFYPSFTISGGFAYQAFKTSFLFLSPQSIAYSAVGTLIAPLINRAAIKTEFKSATANQYTALYNYQKTIINGYVEVYNELATIKSLTEIYAFKSQQADVLKESIEISSELFKTGRANYLEVLMTQRGALEAKLAVIEVKKRQYHARVNIYKALGGGWR